MIPEADRKAALAYLDNIERALDRLDASAIFEHAGHASKFYGRLVEQMETDEEALAIRYGLDAIGGAVAVAFRLAEDDPTVAPDA